MTEPKYQKLTKNSSSFKRALLNMCIVATLHTIPQLAFEWEFSGSIGIFQFEQYISLNI
jgi:hypothetical protein